MSGGLTIYGVGLLKEAAVMAYEATISSFYSFDRDIES